MSDTLGWQVFGKHTAMRVESVERNREGLFVTFGGDVSMGVRWGADALLSCEPVRGDWLVKGWPNDVFMSARDFYDLVVVEIHHKHWGEIMRDGKGMSFSDALEHLKAGKRVARAGWNGKGMFLFLVQGSRFKVNRPPLLGIYPEGHEVDYHAHVDMKTAQGDVVPWACSQTDMLADDWELVQPAELPLLERGPLAEAAEQAGAGAPERLPGRNIGQAFAE